MKMKVFGIGLHKTGTTTFLECCRMLGYKLFPEKLGYKLSSEWLSGNYTPILEAARDYEAFEDSPWCHPKFYEVLSRAFPEAKFVLTVRETDSWFASLKRWVYHRKLTNPAELLVRRAVYGIENDIHDEEALKQLFVAHNTQAVQFFAENPNFQVLDWEAGDGWSELCHFLGEPIPPVPFPHMLKYDPNTGLYVNIK